MPEELHFVADAALIDRLGRELVGKQETALVELVKNSYDADATEVGVSLDADSLTIDDDGTGMDRAELIAGFLRLASDVKVREPVSQRFGRQQAGRKGIGRFATQRLGTALVLRTWKGPNCAGLELDVNWLDFEQGRSLDTIPVRLKEINSRHAGTEISISGLRDSWSEAQIRRCWRGASSLQQPFPVAPVAHEPNQDPGFEVTFYERGETRCDLRIVANLETEVLSHMHAVVEFSVDDSGAAEWRLRNNRFGPDLDWMPTNHSEPETQTPQPYTHIRNAWMRAHYAILEPGEFSPMAFPRIRELLRSDGGIRLYRNGFRVIPFGEPEDDWLRLDEAYGKRSFLFPIANRNWFGVIDVRDEEGERFEERTSREGLIETPAFEELRDLASSVLISAAQKVAEQRNRKIRAGGTSSGPTDHYLERIRDAARRAREAEGANELKGKREGGSGGSLTADLLDEAGDIIEEVEGQYADEAAMLRLLATLGLAASEFSHETGMTFQAVRYDFQHVFELAIEGRGQEDPALELVGRVKGMVERLDALTSYLNEVASARSVRELVPVSLTKAVEDFEGGIRQLAARSEVDLKSKVPALDGLYTKPMHKAEVASILLNFYSNSLKAMKRTDGVRRILVEGRRVNGEVVLRFSDSGDGIPEANRERIFDLFFTTRAAPPASSSTLEEASGTGMGLWIVNQIASRAGGRARVVDAESGFSTTLEVRLPAGEEET